MQPNENKDQILASYSIENEPNIFFQIYLKTRHLLQWKHRKPLLQQYNLLLNKDNIIEYLSKCFERFTILQKYRVEKEDSNDYLCDQYWFYGHIYSMLTNNIPDLDCFLKNKQFMLTTSHKVVEFMKLKKHTTPEETQEWEQNCQIMKQWEQKIFESERKYHYTFLCYPCEPIHNNDRLHMIQEMSLFNLKNVCIVKFTNHRYPTRYKNTLFTHRIPIEHYQNLLSMKQYDVISRKKLNDTREKWLFCFRCFWPFKWDHSQVQIDFEWKMDESGEKQVITNMKNRVVFMLVDIKNDPINIYFHWKIQSLCNTNSFFYWTDDTCFTITSDIDRWNCVGLTNGII